MRLLRARLGQVRLGQVADHRRRDGQRTGDLVGGVVATAEPDEQLRQLGPHLGRVGIERQHALELVGRLLPALFLFVEVRARHVLVGLGAHRARHHQPPVHDLGDRRRRRRAPDGEADQQQRNAPLTIEAET